jgi:hypothetical protein
MAKICSSSTCFDPLNCHNQYATLIPHQCMPEDSTHGTVPAPLVRIYRHERCVWYFNIASHPAYRNHRLSYDIITHVLCQSNKTLYLTITQGASNQETTIETTFFALLRPNIISCSIETTPSSPASNQPAINPHPAITLSLLRLS